MSADHPWQLFPGKLMSYALDLLQSPSEFDQIVGFLLLDVGVETIFKVFLLLPEEVTTTDMPYTKRKNAAEGNFHELVKGVKTAAKTAGDRLKGINLEHVEYFHGLRNKLYHAGNGITVQGDHAEQYSKIALELLDRLLGVPLKSSLYEESCEQDELESLRDKVEQVKAALRAEIHALRQDLRLAVEKVEPAFVMPSFELEIESWSIEGIGAMLLSDPRFFDEVTVIEFGGGLPDEGSRVVITEDGAEVSRFRRNELRHLMPSSLRRFVDKHQVETATAARFLMVSDITEFLLIVAEVAFELPITSTTHLYNSVRLFLSGLLPPSPGDMGADDRLRRALHEGKGLVTKVQKIREAMNASAA